MTLSQHHDTIVWYIIKIQRGSEELWLGQGGGLRGKVGGYKFI